MDYLTEFNLKNINFDATTTLDNFNWVNAFGTATNRFNIGYKPFMAFRAIGALIIFASFIATLTQYSDSSCIKYWPIYLTNWNLCLSMAYAASGALTTYNIHRYGDTYDPLIIPKHVQFHWLLQNPAFVTSLVVPILFWPGCAIANNPPDSCYPSQVPTTVFVHGINSAIVVADVIVSNQPYMVLHGIYAIGFGGLYMTWTYVHHALKIGNCENPDSYTPIYEFVDWGHGFNLYKGFICLLGIPLVNFVGWYIYYKKKSKIHNLERTKPALEIEYDATNSNIIETETYTVNYNDHLLNM